MKDPPAMCVRGVSVGPSDAPAFRNLEFELSTGEILGVTAVGSTDLARLLEVLSGFELPTAGEITWGEISSRSLGEATGPVARYRAEQALRRRVGFLSASASLLENLTIFDNVALPLRYHDSQKEDVVEERTIPVLERLKLADAEARRPAGLPIGVRRRAELARALVLDPAILLWESPFTQVDFESGNLMAGEITRRQRENGLSVLATSFDATQLLPIATRFLILCDDSLAGSLDWQEVRDRNIFADKARLLKTVEEKNPPEQSHKEPHECAPPSAS
jgi:ABC-type transporter Mla maintaining outer membrane lipid asymmetry ATPase subunit MlaF